MAQTIDPSWENFKISFGKYKNSSIYEVFIKDPQYIGWLSKESFMDDVRVAALHVIAGKPIPQPEAPAPVDAVLGDFKITFGKHKGKTMGEIYLIDSSYIRWLSKESYMENVKENAQAIIDNDPAHIEHLKEKK